ACARHSGAGRARRRPVPRGLARQEPSEQGEGEPASLDLVLPEQPIGQEDPRARPFALRRIPEAAGDRLDQRPSDAVALAHRRHHHVAAFVVLGIGEVREPVGEDRREAVWIALLVREAPAKGLSLGLVRGDESDRPLRDRTDRGGRAHSATRTTSGTRRNRYRAWSWRLRAASAAT